MFILKFLKNKIIYLIVILLLGYFIFRLESLNFIYSNSKNIEKENLTVSAESLKRSINVSEILKGDLLDIEFLYLLNQKDYKVPFNYSSNPNFYDEINNTNLFKGLFSVFIEKELNVELLSNIDLGIDVSKLIYEESENFLRISYSSDVLVNIDNSYSESIFNSDVGLFRKDFSESDRALILEDMNKVVIKTILSDSNLMNDFKNRIKEFLLNKTNIVFDNYDVSKKIEIEIDFSNL